MIYLHVQNTRISQGWNEIQIGPVRTRFSVSMLQDRCIPYSVSSTSRLLNLMAEWDSSLCTCLSRFSPKGDQNTSNDCTCISISELESGQREGAEAHAQHPAGWTWASTKVETQLCWSSGKSNSKVWGAAWNWVNERMVLC